MNNPHLEAILTANPVLSNEEIVREACRDIIESKFRYLTENYQFRPFFRQEYASTPFYDAALQDLSKDLKQTFKELRDNAEDAATRKIFDGYFRTAHLQLKNKTARAEYKEELRLLAALNATEGEREVVADAKEREEKAIYFDIIFQDRAAKATQEVRDAVGSKDDLEQKLDGLLESVRPIKDTEKKLRSNYQNIVETMLEGVGDELTEAQRQRTEAASIALGREYTRVRLRLENLDEATLRMLEIGEEDQALRNVQRMLAEIKAQGAERNAEYVRTFFRNYDPEKARYAEQPSVLDEKPSVLDEKPVYVTTEVLEKRLKRSRTWDKITGAVHIGLFGAAVAALVAGVGYFAQVSNEAYHTIKNSLAPQQEQVEVVGEAYKPAETIEQKVNADALKKARVKKQDASITTQAPTANYEPRGYKVKPRGATYNLGIEVPKLPEYRQLYLRVDPNTVLTSIHYSGTLPERNAPDKLVIARF
ncbi:MAG: hypothetical protein AABX98_03320 [Nanoarchaeota archaeon]